jgi:hypothetical protein
MLALALALVLTQPEPLSREEQYTRLVVSISPEGPRMGEGGPLLKGDVFYDFVGQRELASEYRARDRLRNRLAFIGTQGLGAGIFMALAGAAGFLCGDIEATCSPVFDVLLWSGGALVVGGTTTVAVATQIEREVRSPDERFELARRYNAALKERLFGGGSPTSSLLLRWAF